MSNKIQATESDVSEPMKALPPMNGDSDLDTKMMYLAQEMDLFNQRMELIEKAIDTLADSIQSHRHTGSGEAMFPFQKG